MDSKMIFMVKVIPQNVDSKNMDSYQIENIIRSLHCSIILALKLIFFIDSLQQ